VNNPTPSGPTLPPPQRFISLPVVRPRITYVLIGINIAVFLGQILTDSDLWFFFGAKINEFIVAGEWWRLVTPIFLHANLIHLAVNGYSLFIFGTQVEALFSYKRYLVIYMLSGIASTVLSFIMSPEPSVGASGAIFGLVGAMLVHLYRHRKLFGERGRRRLIDVAVIAGINLLIGLNPGIDNWGHLGGLIGGVVLAWLIGPIYTVSIEQITLNAKVEDANPLAGNRWLAVFAVTFALLAITLLASTYQR
jgi:rhomboid protease GluP